jgi:hypothetical protein
MRYFLFSYGQAGCMPDSFFTFEAATLRDLRNVALSECEHSRDAGHTGASKRNGAAWARMAWNHGASTILLSRNAVTRLEEITAAEYAAAQEEA